VLYRTACIALSLASCTLLSGAENRSDFFRVPDPEEIFEAYREGFIDYRDYRELLETARNEFLSPGDSLLLLQFPDLLAGISSHPLIETDDIAFPAAATDESARESVWRQAALFRQYQRLDKDNAFRRLYRLQGDYRRVRVYGEYEREYSGRRTWYRRSLTYAIGSDSGRNYAVVLGNFTERFGLGLMYGYHGRLVSVSDDATGSERLLYPDCGGSNGILVEADGTSGKYRLVFDIDRDDTFETRLIAASVSRKPGIWEAAISAGRGKLRNRETGVSIEFGVFSVFGGVTGDGFDVIGEVAAAENKTRWPMAAAARMTLRRGQLRLRMDAWKYDRGYPSFFAGGPSSRRSRTVEVEEMAYSYSDRYRGERGIIVNGGHPLVGGMTMHTSMMYADRGFGDDRMEARLGVNRRVVPTVRMEIDGYWRSDDLYAGETRRRRAQFELVHSLDGIRSRFVIGRRFDADPYRNDYLIVVSSHVRGRWGAASGVVKFDQVSPGEWTNRYVYATAQYELSISRYFSTYIKYSHRYHRGDPDNSFGIFRWDVRWVIQ